MFLVFLGVFCLISRFRAIGYFVQIGGFETI